jgi:hypothetical protein
MSESLLAEAFNDFCNKICQNLTPALQAKSHNAYSAAVIVISLIVTVSAPTERRGRDWGSGAVSQLIQTRE